MSPEQEQTTALASLIEKLKDNNINLSKIFKTSSPGKGKRKVNGMIQKRSCQTVLIWQGEIRVEEARDKNGEASTKRINDKTYFWCPTHQACTIHIPEECKIKM